MVVVQTGDQTDSKICRQDICRHAQVLKTNKLDKDDLKGHSQIQPKQVKVQ